MKIIGLLPVKNEAWVLPHALASLSAFCDVVIVADQNSDDASREICRTFPKVVLIESGVIRTVRRAPSRNTVSAVSRLALGITA